MNDILRARGRGRIGPISHAQTVAVASLLAHQCGALQYMIEYSQKIQNGLSAAPPPIALPPKKIESKDKGTSSTTTSGLVAMTVDTSIMAT